MQKTTCRLLVPASAAATPVESLGFRRQTLRALQRAGVYTAGQLDGLTPLEMMERCGMGFRPMANVFYVLGTWTVEVPLPGFEVMEKRTDAPPPPFLASILVDRVAPRYDQARVLSDSGLETAADVWPLTAEAIRWATGLSPRTAEAVLGRVLELAGLPVDRLRVLTGAAPDAVPCVPDVRPDVLRALVRARTLDDEIDALVAGANERNAEILLRRWGARGLPIPSYAALGRELGISGPRVRGIILDKEHRLRYCGVRLPAGTFAVERVARSPEPLESDTLTAEMQAAGLLHDPVRLHALPYLSTLGLVPDVAFAVYGGLWFIPHEDDDADDAWAMSPLSELVSVRPHRDEPGPQARMFRSGFMFGSGTG